MGLGLDNLKIVGILIVTFYTVSKVKILRSLTDHRIGVSKGWSYTNIVISTIAYSVGIHWLQVYSNDGGVLLGVPLFVIGTLLTIIFLHYDSLCCCCCECCFGEEQVVIHDPSNPGTTLVWRDGQVN